MPEREIDELFGAGLGATTPRSRLIVGLLALGGALTLFGMLCTPVLGAIPPLLRGGSREGAGPVGVRLPTPHLRA